MPIPPISSFHVISAAVLAIVVVLAGCPGSEATLSANDYDASCLEDRECVGVAFGDVCAEDFCPCPTGAINVSARPAYDVDFTEANKSCPPWRETVLCRCINTESICAEGTCAAVPRPLE